MQNRIRLGVAVPLVLSLGSLVVCSFLSATSVLNAAPTAAARPRAESFIVALERDWSKIDTNGDGVLSSVEIDRAVLNPEFKNEDAAVAASLKLAVRGAKVALPPLTHDYFVKADQEGRDYRARRAAASKSDTASTRPNDVAIDDALRGGSPRDEASTRPDAQRTSPSVKPSAAASDRPSPDWDLLYLVGKRRISAGNKIVWPEHGLSLTNMRQGPLGDCFFVSVVGAMVDRDPLQVERMVTPIEGGAFRVSFPATQPIIVAPLTQAQIAISSTTAGDGVWLAIFEQAFGRYRLAAHPTTSEVIEAADAIAHGGSTGPTMTALTGHDRKRFVFSPSLERRAQKRDELLPTLRKELIAAMKAELLVTTGVNTPPTTMPAGNTAVKIPAGINTKHAYAIVNYDEKTDRLELWNPHGQLFKPKGEPGLINGYPTEHGRFSVPLVEAYQFLSGITIETTLPPTPMSTTMPAARPANKPAAKDPAPAKRVR